MWRQQWLPELGHPLSRALQIYTQQALIRGLKASGLELSALLWLSWGSAGRMPGARRSGCGCLGVQLLGLRWGLLLFVVVDFGTPQPSVHPLQKVSCAHLNSHHIRFVYLENPKLQQAPTFHILDV